MKKLILFIALVGAVHAETPTVIKPEPKVEPTELKAKDDEIAKLKERIAQLEKALTILKQQRDQMATQLLDMEANARLQAPPEKKE